MRQPVLFLMNYFTIVLINILPGCLIFLLFRPSAYTGNKFLFLN